MLTSNKHVQDPARFPDDDVLAAVILDGLLLCAQVLHNGGRSYPLRERAGSSGRGRTS